ncbi:aldehyde ferredoxin oxidoreductase [Archaeoglobales archaeon]|nr:MAG: aldehyde ferredoxin oxidoreductase [Archaeoglobales archaeon]
MAYTGLALEVDLSERDFSEVNISDKKYEKYAGVIGVGYEFATKLYKKKMDPFGDRNFVIFCAGLLVATGVPATKTTVITKNPLNSTFGPGVVGGRLAHDIKKAGYDFILLRGKSDDPVVLKITPQNVEFQKAGRLWGKDIVKVTETLKKKEKGSVVAIGPAGENLVPISIALVDGIHHIGKGGLGAVLGSKKVKAIVVRGDKREMTIFDREKFKEYSKILREKILADKLRKIYSELGIMSAWDAWAKQGYLTYRMRNKQASAGMLSEFGAEKYLYRVKKRSIGCYGCPSPCKAEVNMPGGRTTKTSVYLGLAMSLGIKCGIQTAEEAVECHDIANRLGVDELIFSELFDALVTFKEEAKIFEDEIGFEISRDAKSVKTLLNLIAYKMGIGEYLAKGMDGLVERFGEWVKEENDFIKNMDWVFDPRVSFGSESFGQLTNLRGGHEGPVTITVLEGRSEESLRRYVRRIGGDEEKIFENGFRAELYTLATENWLWVLNGMGFCRRESIARNLDITLIKNLFNTSTGFELEEEDIIDGARKAISLARALNCKEGYNYSNDLPPKKFFEPLKVGSSKKVLRNYLTGKEISEGEVLEMLRNYYSERGWGRDGCP